MKRYLAPIAFTFLALFGLGFALMDSAPHMRSNCNEPVSGPWIGVVLGLVVYAVFGYLAVRRDLKTAFAIVLATALSLLVNDWATEKALDDVLRSNCETWILR